MSVRLENGARVYLFKKYCLHTHDEVKSAAKKAEQKGCSVKGVKGYSPLASTLDLIECVPSDYLHAVLEGVVKLLMKHWFILIHHT